MPTTRLYSGSTNPSAINRTTAIENAVGLFIVSPDIADEIEIDFYLQLEVSPLDTRLVKLNESLAIDTLTVYQIPQEYQNTGLRVYGAFITTLPVSVEVWAITQNCTQQEVCEIVTEIQSVVTENRNLNRILTANQIVQNVTLGIFATAWSPLTFGATATALPVLTGGANLLLPVGGGLLP